MLGRLQTIAILVNLEACALSELGLLGTLSRNLGGSTSSFSLPIGLTWESRSEGGPVQASKPQPLSHLLLVQVGGCRVPLRQLLLHLPESDGGVPDGASLPLVLPCLQHGPVNSSPP